ncbi:F-box protein At4g22280-like isoform X1 [Papaver somniferum]|uniref:F-box protein At4g22280-like isoform X1 n=1 Tax=Papaver somniferum TaxID=3469 RepID=UPI000E706026|nr:F-box protein At4g22280-like isoform X1 [Papaver somniferum]
MSNIGKFSLSCDKHCDEDRVHSWLSAVARRNVEEFSLLSEDERDSGMIPSLLFTCETLTLLKIQMPISLNIPTNVHLPKLKVLRLINIRFMGGSLIEKLCSNCLTLEELEINNCIIEDITEISISSHTLKRMFIDAPSSYHQIDIDAPSLEVFQHKGTLAEVYDLHSFPSLIDANISLSDINDWIDEDENIATNLLVHLFNVKRLVAGSCFLGALSHVDDDVFYELPSFDKLTCLEVVWNSPDLVGNALMRLLQISPNLETLCLFSCKSPISQNVLFI